MVDYRSVSQINQYLRCPLAYKRQRIDRVPEMQSPWFPQGLAVHKGGEEFEKSNRTMSLEQIRQVFSDEYARQINKTCEKVPNFDWWFSSGPYRAGESYTSYKGKYYQSDISRRYQLGLEQVERYHEYYTSIAPEEKIWITPDGEPAIELEYYVDLDGIMVKGAIDQIIKYEGIPSMKSSWAPDEIRVRDIKSGKQPGGDFQLAVYAIIMWVKYGVVILVGDYWMGHQGKPTKEPYKLDHWTYEKVSEEFHTVDAKIRAGDFPADPDPDKCRMCSVKVGCPFSLADA